LQAFSVALKKILDFENYICFVVAKMMCK